MKKELTKEEKIIKLVEKEARLVLLKKKNTLRTCPKRILKNVEEERKRKLI
ncbi:MAG: hypothetical protein J6O56_03185 [Bacilli bacterium]|nr:hypothetical protein [Bacilli bacterium]